MKWISVKDKLPKITEWVLVYQDGTINCCAFDDKIGWFDDWVGMTNPNILFSYITHWMPLPKPPMETMNRQRTIKQEFYGNDGYCIICKQPLEGCYCPYCGWNDNREPQYKILVNNG